MTESWQPTGTWIRRFRKALDESFDEPSMQLLTVDYFWPHTFTKISSPGIGKTFEFRLQELINQAQMEDWLVDLVAAARERRPKNSQLASIAEALGLTMTGPRLSNPTGHSLEELVQANAKFINPTVFRERLPGLEGQVCWIDIPGGGGTGFLVGPDLLLTNQHVIERITQHEARQEDVRCRFDYRRPLVGSLTAKKPTEVGLAEQWLVDSRPPSPFDWEPGLGDASKEETDTALLRLAEPIGELPLGGPSSDPADPPRGWIAVGAPPPPVSAGNQVFLLQHPAGEPLQLAVGTVTGFNQAGTRIRYNANSKDGSSGSPCLDADLSLVALHHAHDPAYPPAWNQAVPLRTIQEVWNSHGIVVE